MTVNTHARRPLLFVLAITITLAWFGSALPAAATESFEVSGTVVATLDGLLEIELDDGRRVLARPPASTDTPEVGERVTARVAPVADIFQVIEFQPSSQH